MKGSRYSTENIVGKPVPNSNSCCQVQRGHRHLQSAYMTQLLRLGGGQADETTVASGPRALMVNGGRMKSRVGQPGMTTFELRSAVSATGFSLRMNCLKQTCRQTHR